MNCCNCINWIDESLAAIEVDQNERPHTFMGCRIFGFLENTEIERCDSYQETDDLFTVCNSCKLPVPKVCVSLGECVNCTDTDLYCVDSCKGGESRKYCTHFVRLRTEGLHLIDNEKNEVFDLFPALDLPGAHKDDPVAEEEARENESSE